MKKKLIIFLGLVLIVIVSIFVLSKLLRGNKNIETENVPISQDFGIEYFEVPDIEQVYINGIIQPEQAESFAKDEKMTSEPVIKVKNGDIVESGTELYVYEDKEITKEIENQTNTLNKLYTQRQNIYNKWNRALETFNQTSEEERTSTKATIDDQYQAEIDSVDEEIYFSNETISNLTEKQYVSTTAKFKGRISIPEVKDENAPILSLTSDGLYVAGKVNEKDLMKIAVDQKANLSVISSGTTVTGKISYINDSPSEAETNQSENNSEAGTMSSYDVKLALDSVEGIKNGYHIQAIIDLGDNEPILIPKKAIHEQEGIKYVLVNDFGSIIRRDVQVGEEKGDEVTINFGLESADRVIVSSEKEVKEGDLVGDETQMDTTTAK